MKKDRDVFEAIIAKLTSLKTVVSLKGNQSFRGSIRGPGKIKKNAIRSSKSAAKTARDPSQQRADVHRTLSKLILTKFDEHLHVVEMDL